MLPLLGVACLSLAPVAASTLPLARPGQAVVVAPVATPVPAPLAPVSSAAPAAEAAPAINLASVMPSVAPAKDAEGGQPAMRIWSPEILSGEDRELYRRIFTAVEQGRFKQADDMIARLRDRRLMGHVLHAKYMGRHYRTSYAELRDWLTKYNDLPGAADIHKLALRRKPASAAAPQRPAQRRWRQPAYAIPALNDGAEQNPSASFRTLDNEVRRMLRTGKAEAAHSYLKRRNIRARVSDLEYDRLRQRIVTSYFLEGENNKAYLLANEILQAHPREIPLADWYAGLAAWRMDSHASAARHFERLANSGHVSGWSKAAGGFWAARAWLASGAPEKVAPLLELAAGTGPTFYGILATRQLGRSVTIDWVEPRLDEDSFRMLTEYDSVARAVALVQTGRREAAREELERAHGLVDASLDQALIALAAAYNLPSVQLQVANAARLPAQETANGRITLNAGLFPVPDWQPSTGYKIDQALLLAFMRQESKFRPDAMSYAGARGLMQIMPATASHITQDNSLARGNKDRLLDPTFNLTLGQEYIAELLGAGEPYGNLFMLTTAYNGGPGNLNRWLASIDFQGDPFLFIESIPAAETRGYIERVVTNYWIYSSRLDQPSRSLDASASGTWPVYEATKKTR